MDFKAGMFFYALAFLLGIVLVQQLSVLPDISLLFYLLAALVILSLSAPYLIASTGDRTLYFDRYFTLTISIIMLFIAGFCYATFLAKNQLEHRLDETLAGQDIVLSGRVATIPVENAATKRFEFEIYSFELVSENSNDLSVEKTRLPEKVRLSWYYGSDIKAGETWQFLVRLKPPHGFMNPGGFDYESWLFQQHIHATGYIRKSEDNRRLAAAPVWSINRIRQILAGAIDNRANDFSAVNAQTVDKASGADTSLTSLSLVKALAVGDKSSITTAQWDVLRRTGTSHLMAISGLHIGLASLFVYVLIRRVLPGYVMKRMPAQHVAIMAGAAVALLYALVAGFSIPTQRAVIMLFTLSLMLLMRRNHRPLDALGLALFVVLLIDPLAVLSAGFWFSFSAVAVIFISVSKADKRGIQDASVWLRLALIVREWLKLQLMISLFLLPLSLYMFQQASLVSPLANLLLIPYVSFLVVPIVLLGIICSFLFQQGADLLFDLAATLLNLVWPVLSYLAEQPYAYWVKGDLDIITLLFVTVALFAVYLSWNIPGGLTRWSVRVVSFAVFSVLFSGNKSSLKPDEFTLTVLDVGQGSAAIVQTKAHTLVFDAGAKFSDAMDVGKSVVLPYLRYLGDVPLDRLIISHGDNDHIGGAQSVIDAYPDIDVIGQDLETIISPNKQACFNGAKWQWDGVSFEFLSPDANEVAPLQGEKRNNRSCVLRVASPYGSTLFTGDIEQKIEQRLIASYAEGLASDILIVPHHGSNTSSSQSFIEAIKPEYSIISVGYKNRYKLPSSKVVARYKATGFPVLSTDNSGAITVKISANDDISIERYRDKYQRYWNHRWN